MAKYLKIIGFRFTFIFAIAFILTLSFPFYVLPNVGKITSPLTQSINQIWASLFGVSEDAYLIVISDSTGLFLNLITLVLISFVGAIIWNLTQKSTPNTKLKQWFTIGVAYYLALILLKYGFDKIFKHQFYLPEPNTLYTPLGDLSKDILFWSSMGSSYSYSVFSGLIEVIPAILLLFRKTRLIGALITMAVIVNVIFLNFGFDISVKVYSTFLFCLSLIVIAPNFKPLYLFFIKQESAQQKVVEHQFKNKKNVLKYAIAKSLIIGLFLFESLGGFFETNNFNDDTFPRPYLHGAYTNINSDETIKRVFIHRKQYFIIQTNADKFKSYELKFSEDLTQLILTNYIDEHFILDFQVNEIGDISVQGIIENDTINLVTVKADLNELSLLKYGSFYWTFD